MRVYVEQGRKRAFAGALEWPGWCRSARDEEGALDALLAYASRYRKAIATARAGFQPPPDATAFVVVERLKGTATTDFGAPGVPPSIDAEPLEGSEWKRQVRLLRACWGAFDDAADAARGLTLAKGPRGGGRTVAKIVAHVFEADQGYLTVVGGSYRGKDTAPLRAAFVDALEARGRGDLPDVGPRGGKRWTARYAIRRSAWHALDHAWEIEDRSSG